MSKSNLFREIVTQVYEARRDRLVNPEGEFDRQGRWYPSKFEDCGGSGSSTRGPSRAWPYSYMVRCRTRQHCTNLVEAYLAGANVPSDLMAAISGRFPGESDEAIRLAIRCDQLGIKPQFRTSTVAALVLQYHSLEVRPILADALEDAGCTNAKLLDSLRAGLVAA